MVTQRLEAIGFKNLAIVDGNFSLTFLQFTFLDNRSSGVLMLYKLC